MSPHTRVAHQLRRIASALSSYRTRNEEDERHARDNGTTAELNARADAMADRLARVADDLYDGLS